ncbi:serine/threonine-protein kinase [Spirillospora sp. NPDC052242]
MRALEPGDPRSAGRLRILARIGAGGMGTIYFGRSAGGRPAAVKVLHAEFARDPAYRERFRREADVTRAVGGRFGPGVLDADPGADRPWLATEFLPSVSLREAVEMLGPLPAGPVRALAAGVAEALASVHGAGVVHLDVKPANVLLTADGPRLIDFGVAAFAGGPPDGERAGTPGFMSPEQAEGGPAGPASDVFSFGATLVYACTGAAPSGGSLQGVADEGLRAAVAACLRPDPDDRPTVAELVSAFAGEPSGGWPPAVAARIAHRAAEAANPPVPVPVPRRSVGRPVALAGGVLAAAAVGAAAVLAVPGTDERPAAVASRPSARPAGTIPPSANRTAARTLEFYVFGSSRLESLTITVNGKRTAVRDRRLPYRKVVRIPAEPTSWRLDYRFGEGTFAIAVSVDGSERGGAGGSSRGPDVTDSAEGTV